VSNVDSGEVFVRVGGNDTDPALMWLGPSVFELPVRGRHLGWNAMSIKVTNELNQPL